MSSFVDGIFGEPGDAIGDLVYTTESEPVRIVGDDRLGALHFGCPIRGYNLSRKTFIQYTVQGLACDGSPSIDLDDSEEPEDKEPESIVEKKKLKAI